MASAPERAPFRNGTGAASAPGPVGDLIVRSLARYAGRTAFVIGDRSLSYEAAGECIGKLIQLLDRLGMQPGETVVQFARNSPEQWFLTAACYLLGLRSVTLHPNLTEAADQAALMTFTDARLFVCDSSFASRIDLFRSCSPAVRHWYTHDRCGELPNLWSAAEGFTKQPLRNRAGPEDIVRIGFTSGTTGPRKGVMLSSRALGATALVNLADGEWPAAPRVLCAEPIAGGFGNMIVPTLVRGGTFIMQPGFEPGEFIDGVSRHRPSVLLMMPPALLQLLDDAAAARADWSSLSLLVYSGGSLTKERVRQAAAMFGPVLCQVFGQTECPKGLAILRPFEHSHGSDSVARSLGMPCSGNHVVLLREDQTECGPGEPGELCVRGPVTASGYWKLPELTAKALRGNWWHTGDRCYADAQGYLHFVGRMPIDQRPAAAKRLERQKGNSHVSQ